MGSLKSVFSTFLDVSKFSMLDLVITISLALIIALIIALVWQFRILSVQQENLLLRNHLMKQIKFTNKLEDNLQIILNHLEKSIKAPYYAFYIMDTRSNQYILRTVSHPFDDFEGIGPAYSGLALPKKESYLPPLSLDVSEFSKSVEWSKTGDVPIILLKFGNRKAIIRIGPVTQLITKLHRQLTRFVSELDVIVDDLVTNELNQMRNEVLEMADKAIKEVASVATDKQAAIEVVIRSFIGISGGIGGLLIEVSGSQTYQIFQTFPLETVKKQFLEQPTYIEQLRDLLIGKSYRLITRLDNEFYGLPNFLLDMDVAAILLIQTKPNGMLVLLYGQDFNQENFNAMGLVQCKLLSEQLSFISDRQKEREKLSKSYAKMLWKMADATDVLQPYTVGYSERMTRYSLVIGKELGMSDEELVDLSIAAHLSNIGTIGLQRELLTKVGKYSDFEYETIKLHSEIGASMIQIATGNSRISSYVLHHHERMDGNGYPHGLRGKDIPLGAKILHTVQVFLAKVDGRSWRVALPFEQALDALQSMAPKQLDASVVQAFVDWWERKGREASLKNTTIGRCYEMVCTPLIICESCLVYNMQDSHCWEVGNNQCKVHGRECATCFVHTEYLSRERHA